MAEKEPKLKDPEAQKMHKEMQALMRSMKRVRNKSKTDEQKADERVDAARRMADAARNNTLPAKEVEQPEPQDDTKELEALPPNEESEEARNLLARVQEDVRYYSRHIEYLNNRPYDSALPKEMLAARKELGQLRKKEQELEDAIQKALSGTGQLSQDDEERKPPAPKMAHKEFVAQQEDVWGANRDIAPEDIPKGELTYEQFLEKRPKDGIYHADGWYYDTKTNKFTNEAAYLEQQVRAEPGKTYIDTVLEPQRQKEVDAAHEKGLEQLKELERQESEKIRHRVEAELLIKQDPELSKLWELHEEITELQDSSLGYAEYYETVVPVIEKKDEAFWKILRRYQSGDADARVLDYIEEQIIDPIEKQKIGALDVGGIPYYKGKRVDVVGVKQATKDTPSEYEILTADGEKNFVKTKLVTLYEDDKHTDLTGSPYYKDEKVQILSLRESPDGPVQYEIKRADGAQELIDADQVTFKQEKEETPEEQSEKKFVKRWWRKNREQSQRFGGVKWFADQWALARQNVRDHFLNKGAKDEGVTNENAERRQNANRVKLSAGGSVMAVGGLSAFGRSIYKKMRAQNEDSAVIEPGDEEEREG